MKTYLIMDGRAQSGTQEGFDRAYCLESCETVGEARVRIKEWESDSTVWEIDESGASPLMVYANGVWFIDAVEEKMSAAKYILCNDVKKGMEIRTTQLGAPVSGVMADNGRGITRLIDTHGEEVGLFNELGSVYASDIAEAKVNGEWLPVLVTKAQAKQLRSAGQTVWRIVEE